MFVSCGDICKCIYYLYKCDVMCDSRGWECKYFSSKINVRWIVCGCVCICICVSIAQNKKKINQKNLIKCCQCAHEGFALCGFVVGVRLTADIPAVKPYLSLCVRHVLCTMLFLIGFYTRFNTVLLPDLCCH